MRKGFIFNHELCVNCSACSAACILENGWTIQSRRVYTYNSETYSSLPLIHLSLACNHCEIPACLDSCPTSSYKRDPLTEAIIIDEKRCIGCKYCQWNCPYDAPKFDSETRVIGKCNLCNSGLKEGHLPACTTACPTGALGFGWLSDSDSNNYFPWIPDKNLKPGINFTGNLNYNPLIIIPDKKFVPGIQLASDNAGGKTFEWSLFAFSFLTTISVALTISSLVIGTFPDLIQLLSINIFAGIISLFHPGRPSRSWRSVSNLARSPLSREIALFISYFILSAISIIFQTPGFLIAASVTGLILLIFIDAVYIYTNIRRSLTLHSGQTFFSGLLIVSFFTGSLLPFIFIAVIKLFPSVYCLINDEKYNIPFGVRFIRIVLLIITGVSLASKISYPDPVISSIFIIGEIIDRIIFYKDFSPVNIKKEIFKLQNFQGNEKERGQ
jgi:anaerobic dimethyl sulfoxide reductase subunit B (iron-sulfur subunit)